MYQATHSLLPTFLVSRTATSLSIANSLCSRASLCILLSLLTQGSFCAEPEPIPPFGFCQEAKLSSTNTSQASDSELYLDRKLAYANPKKDNPDLPNVLLIGDSISIGYTAYVRKQLKQTADVYRIPTNARNSEYGLKYLDKWLELDSVQWDVIHFNWGLWDLCYRHPESTVQGNRDKLNGSLTETLEGYQMNLERIVARLKKTDAKLIWCATTPIPKDEAGRKLGDDLRYNQVANRIMKANDVLINDLHSHALLKLPETMVRKGDVHFTEPGYIHLAEKVAAEIQSALK